MKLTTENVMVKSRQVDLTGSPVVKVFNKKVVKSQSLRYYAPRERTPEGIIRDCEELYDRRSFYSLSSGGKDSQTMTDWLAEHDKLTAVVHIKTNVGLSMTTDFLKDFCRSRGYRLHLIEPQPKYIYSSFVLQYGFPGPAIHNMIMGVLKFKTMRDFILSADLKHGCLVSGVRKFESRRRFNNYREPINSDGAMWFAAPLFYYTNEQVYVEYTERKLPISPAYKTGLGTSGECMCGAFAGRGDKEIMRKIEPRLADYIEWLEDGVQKFGTARARKYPTWGGTAKMSEIEQQKTMQEFFTANPHLEYTNEMASIICGQECGPGTRRGMTDF